MKVQYYFESDDSEICYPKEHFLELMKWDNKESMEVFKAELTKDDNYFFCMAVQECGEKGECGVHCLDYSPRNGKNGCCKYYSNRLYAPTEKIILKQVTNK